MPWRAQRKRGNINAAPAAQVVLLHPAQVLVPGLALALATVLGLGLGLGLVPWTLRPDERVLEPDVRRRLHRLPQDGHIALQVRESVVCLRCCHVLCAVAHDSLVAPSHHMVAFVLLLW